MRDDPILRPEDYAELKLLLQKHGHRRRNASAILIQKGINSLVVHPEALPPKLEAVQGTAGDVRKRT